MGNGRVFESIKRKKIPIPKENKNPKIIIRNENKSNIVIG
jgi:hypothetical protein